MVVTELDLRAQHNFHDQLQAEQDSHNFQPGFFEVDLSRNNSPVPEVYQELAFQNGIQVLPIQLENGAVILPEAPPERPQRPRFEKVEEKDFYKNSDRLDTTRYMLHITSGSIQSMIETTGKVVDPALSYLADLTQRADRYRDNLVDRNEPAERREVWMQRLIDVEGAMSAVFRGFPEVVQPYNDFLNRVDNEGVQQNEPVLMTSSSEHEMAA